jgi:hypothetical protein
MEYSDAWLSFRLIVAYQWFQGGFVFKANRLVSREQVSHFQTGAKSAEGLLMHDLAVSSWDVIASLKVFHCDSN